MIDKLTGWAEAIPIPDQSAATVARVVYSEWIARYEVTGKLHLDRGVHFQAAVFADLCATFRIEPTEKIAYRPQANGKCERFNWTLVEMLRPAVQKRPYDWEPLVAPVLQAYRSKISESTGFTLYSLAFGRKIRLPIDFGAPLPEPPLDIRTPDSEIAEDLEWCYLISKEITGFSHRCTKNRYN